MNTLKINLEAKMCAFVDACLLGAPSQAPGEHGLMVQRALNGVCAAAKSGRGIRHRPAPAGTRNAWDAMGRKFPSKQLAIGAGAH